jgi:hypothetical protein
MTVKPPAMHQRLSLIVESAGAHKFAYTKIADATGDAVWRWPNEAPISQLIEAKGQLLNVTA